MIPYYYQTQYFDHETIKLMGMQKLSVSNSISLNGVYYACYHKVEVDRYFFIHVCFLSG